MPLLTVFLLMNMTEHYPYPFKAAPLERGARKYQALSSVSNVAPMQQCSSVSNVAPLYSNVAICSNVAAYLMQHHFSPYKPSLSLCRTRPSDTPDLVAIDSNHQDPDLLHLLCICVRFHLAGAWVYFHDKLTFSAMQTQFWAYGLRICGCMRIYARMFIRIHKKGQKWPKRDMRQYVNMQKYALNMRFMFYMRLLSAYENIRMPIPTRHQERKVENFSLGHFDSLGDF